MTVEAFQTGKTPPRTLRAWERMPAPVACCWCPDIATIWVVGSINFTVASGAIVADTCVFTRTCEAHADEVAGWLVGDESPYDCWGGDANEPIRSTWGYHLFRAPVHWLSRRCPKPFVPALTAFTPWAWGRRGVR